jgi:hypothetical protein
MPRLAHGVTFAVAFAALLVYALTLSPTVAWVNQGEDSGDLLVAAATLGIPHPTGYPLFTLLGRVASLAPLGSLAFRINLIAALAGAAGVFLLARLVLELAPRRGQNPGAGALLGAAAAALVYAFSRGAWSQSVLAEVYTLHIALLGAILWCLARAERASDPRPLALAAYLFGLGLTNHLLLLAAAPALAVAAWRLALRKVIGIPGLVLLPVLAAWGYTLVLYLPIRAAQGPEFSWGVPASPEQLRWVLTGAQYARNLFSRGPGEIAGYLAGGRWWTDFGPALLFLGPAAVAAFALRTGRLLAVTAALAGSLALLAAYAIADDVGYWMPAGYVAAAIAGVGVAELWQRLEGRAGLRAALAAACVAAGACGLPLHARAVDASRDLTPYLYAAHSLEAVEPDALILSEYDGRTFSLWFYKATAFAGTRRRVAVVYKYLLVWPWYLHHLARTYPGLAVPPYQGDLDLAMNRMIARNIRRRPVYLTREDPGLAPVFRVEPVGDPLLPIYRVSTAGGPP